MHGKTLKLVARVIALISMHGNLKLPKINAISDNYLVKSDKKLRSTKKNSIKWLQSFVRRDLTNKFLILSQRGCYRQQFLQIFRFDIVRP